MVKWWMGKQTFVASIFGWYNGLGSNCSLLEGNETRGKKFSHGYF